MAQAAAAAAGQPLWRHLCPEGTALPLPAIQIFGGGAHPGRRVDIQDLMIVRAGAGSFSQALEWTAEVPRRDVERDRDLLAGVWRRRRGGPLAGV